LQGLCRSFIAALECGALTDIDTTIAVTSAAPSGISISGDALTRVFSVLRQIRPGSDITDTSHLSDAGFTSLDMVRIMLDIEAEFALMIPQPEINPENFMSAASIAGLMLRLGSG
jgi:acyl carrier protein